MDNEINKTLIKKEKKKLSKSQFTSLYKKLSVCNMIKVTGWSRSTIDRYARKYKLPLKHRAFIKD